MEVTKTIGPALTTPARTMTAEAMQQDFEYEMAQKFTQALFEKGLISEAEKAKIALSSAQQVDINIHAKPGKILSFLRRYYGEITCYMWPLE